MKTLVISDTHLTKRFNKAKCDFLLKLINQSDRVVINGDFWDSYFCTFDEFVNSKWKVLFTPLKNKQSIYLYGNHDLDTDCDERVELFSDYAGYEYSIKFGGKNLKFEHGHRLDGVFKQNHKRVASIRPLLRLVAYPAALVEWFDTVILKNWNNRRKSNDLKEKYKPEIGPNDVFVYGHTHYAEDDLLNGFINSGFIKYGLASYIWITDTDIDLEKDFY